MREGASGRQDPGRNRILTVGAWGPQAVLGGDWGGVRGRRCPSMRELTSEVGWVGFRLLSRLSPML